MKREETPASMGTAETEPSPGAERDVGEAETVAGGEAKAVYDTNGDTMAAFDKFNEDYPESDESSDLDDDDDYEDSGAPVDVYGDGSVVKTRTGAGSGWERPKDLCPVVVEYAVVAGAAATSESPRPEVCKSEGDVGFVVDEAEAPFGFLDDVLKGMRAEEVASVVVAPGTVEGWPADVPCEMTLTLKSFEKRPVGHEMDADGDKRAHVAELKDNGNKWFKRGDLARAKRRYEAAVYFAEYEEGVKDALPPVWGNLAAVAVTAEDWAGATAAADKCLAFDKTNVKAWYRKGLAQSHLKDFDDAVRALKCALECDPKNAPSRRALKDVLAKRKAAKEAEKAAFNGMFTKLKGFASENRPKDEKPKGGAFDDDYDDWDDAPGGGENDDGGPLPVVHAANLKRAFFEITIDDQRVGTVTFELFDDTVPKTVNNFLGLCCGDNDKKLTYKGCAFHRVIKGFMVQGGDMTKGDGTGGESIYGGKFDDEAFVDNHTCPGLLSMANAGRHTNGSQFFITTVKTPHLDGKHVVFGRVVSGMDVVHKIEDAPVDDASKPKKPCVIADCGELPPEPAEPVCPPPIPNDDDPGDAAHPDAENESDAP